MKNMNKKLEDMQKIYEKSLEKSWSYQKFIYDNIWSLLCCVLIIFVYEYSRNAILGLIAQKQGFENSLQHQYNLLALQFEQSEFQNT